MRHVVDGKLAAETAFRQALGEDARGRAVGHRQAVADEQDDVARLRAGVPKTSHLTVCAAPPADAVTS